MLTCTDLCIRLVKDVECSSAHCRFMGWIFCLQHRKYNVVKSCTWMIACLFAKSLTVPEVACIY